MSVTFENVEITIPNLTAKEAYDLLCSTLEAAGFEYMTDIYSEGRNFGDTDELRNPQEYEDD